MRRLIKNEQLQDISPFQLNKFDTDDQSKQGSPSHADIGLDEESVLKVKNS